MNSELEPIVLQALREKAASGGKLIERLQAEGEDVAKGRSVLVYGALANLHAAGEIVVAAEGPGERVWAVTEQAGAPGAHDAAPGFPPSFSLGAAELALVDRELSEMAKGLPLHYFEELRRVVVADADRRVFHGAKLPRAVTEALRDLGPRGSVRPFLRRVEKGGPVPLRLRPGSLRRRWLVGPLVVAGLLVAVHAFVIRLYTVPDESISMAPALIPGREDGDQLVIADLLAYRTGDPQRGDVAIFERDGKHVVKRVMGLPGETVYVKGEDLFVNGRRFQKERALLDRVKVPLLRLADLAREAEPYGFRMKEPLTARFETPLGTGGDLRREVTDLVVTARIRPSSDAGRIVFELHDGRKAPFTILFEAAGPGGVYVAGVEATKAGQLAAGRETEVWFTNADRSFRVEVDGSAVGEASAIAYTPRPATVTIRPDGVEILSLEIARDLAYAPAARKLSAEGGLKLAEDEYFVLGDNAANSRDSRHFKAVLREELVGRALAVAWPPSRIREIR